MKIAVLGTGAWGTALAVSLSRQHQVALWGRDPAQLAAMAAARENARYLPGVSLAANLALVADLASACRDAALVVSVVPTNALRATLRNVREQASRAPLIWACKGFERGTGKLAHQIVAEELGDDWPAGVLSGPSFALEVGKGLPCALTLASTDIAFAQDHARALASPRLRVYSSDDLVGVEIGGAVKNVMAVAAGISDSLGLGNNARAALITRGLAEIARLGVALGGRMETFMGLTGLGDLVLTCTGDLSRNRRVGMALGRGEKLADIIAGLGQVAEGVASAPEVLRTANQLGIEMPITEAICAVFDGRIGAAAAVDQLMRRDVKAEA